MNIWNKVLVGLNCAASLGLFYVGARTLYTHKAWRENARRYEDKIKQYRAANDRLINGGQGEPGIRQLRLDLNRVLVDRGRVWRNCDVRAAKVDKATGVAVIQIATDQPDMVGIGEKGSVVVYAFEDANVKDKGRYLGEFRMTPTSEKEAILQPTTVLTQPEVTRLASAKKSWVLYEEMPGDNHSVFAGLSDDEKKAMLPDDTALEYVKDGKPAAADDPQERVVDGKYVRPLRDYRTLFNANRTNLIEMIDRFAATTRDKAMIEAALAKANQEEVANKKRIAEANEKLAKRDRERDIIAAYRKTLDDDVAAVTASVADMLKNNKVLADQITHFQWDAARRIDQRTSAMVQSDARGK